MWNIVYHVLANAELERVEHISVLSVSTMTLSFPFPLLRQTPRHKPPYFNLIMLKAKLNPSKIHRQIQGKLNPLPQPHYFQIS